MYNGEIQIYQDDLDRYMGVLDLTFNWGLTLFRFLLNQSNLTGIGLIVIDGLSKNYTHSTLFLNCQKSCCVLMQFWCSNSTLCIWREYSRAETNQGIYIKDMQLILN